MSSVVNVEEEVRQLVADILEVEPHTINPDAKLVEDLGMDSMMALEIVASIEKKYKIKLPEQELRNVTTLNRVIDTTRDYVR